MMISVCQNRPCGYQYLAIFWRWPEISDFFGRHSELVLVKVEVAAPRFILDGAGDKPLLHAFYSTAQNDRSILKP